MTLFEFKKELARLLSESASVVIKKSYTADPESLFEIPREEKFGDLATHVVLKLSKEVKQAPRTLAEALCADLKTRVENSALKSNLKDMVVEGPGFINFYFTGSLLSSVIPEIEVQGANFGRPQGKKKNILLEFVSANPTGPLTVAHGRQAALGDCLARILKFSGHEVIKEYYNNDEGVQIETLGKSTHLRVREMVNNETLPLPENYYQGEYLVETAKKFLSEKGDLFRKADEAEQLRLCMDYAKNDILAGIQKDLKDFDVHFDTFYSQKELGGSGKVEKALEELKTKGKVYESEGAVWLRSTDLGDDKDRVLVKSDKTYTYLTPDIAYHHEKFQRGFDEIINIWGPDHHGYIARLKASQAALGHDPEAITILIAQLVTLYEGKKQVRMSTRAGEFVTLRQILDEVGKDAGRFFFVMRKFDAHLDFDLALAKSQTPDNPVFYIQYAHARIESIKNSYREKIGPLPVFDGQGDAPFFSEPAALTLLRLLSQFPDTVLGAQRTLEPYRLVPYLMELAAAFHRFYTENRVVTDDAALTKTRLRLVNGVQQVLRSGLQLLGVAAPFKM